MEQIERKFKCPYCLQTISMVLDGSVEANDFIEDCEVCCHPIEIFYKVADDQIVEFSARRTDG